MLKIAIDGPSGAGKSTLAKAVAKKMGLLYVDTGAMYRSIGLYVFRKGIDAKDREHIIPLLSEIKLDIRYEEGEQRAYLNGENVNDFIRTPEISMYASAVSAIPEVRTFLLNTQRDLAKEHPVIMDGRDIGTVIFPNANVKIYLTAGVEARAKRRYKELLERGITDTTYEKVLEDMIQRDKNDSERDVAPAVAAPDAIHFDNSDVSLKGSVKACEKIIKKKLKSDKKAYKKSRNIYMRIHDVLCPFLRVYMRIKPYGNYNFPEESGALICSNHISMWDVSTIGSVCDRQVRFIAKAELSNIPLVSKFFKAMGVCFINRKGTDIDAIKKSIEMAKNGELVAIFPQGTRRTGLNVADTQFKNGAALIAFRAKVPIIPVCIVTKNMKYKFMRKKEIYVGKPIPYEELGFVNGGNEEYSKVTERIYKEICALGGFVKTEKDAENGN